MFTFSGMASGIRTQVTLLCVLLLVVFATGAKDNCILKGKISTHLHWYGYILQKTFQESTSLLKYQISYPVSECCANLLIYYEDQMRDLSTDMTCSQREEILPAKNNQVIPLYPTNGTAGCTIWDEFGSQPMYVCDGDRQFKSNYPKTWYVAISRCGESTKPLTLNYYFNISGYYGNCEEDPLADTFIPPRAEVDAKLLHIAIAMGVIAGVAVVVACIFILLYVLSRRQLNQKSKPGGSVTSSQATMTQDIFYVNPSLSDRDHSDSQYSRSSSENYYEVIPDRRSYESINTQLALSGHGGRAVTMGTVPREHRARIPSYIFEDIPPPPYQPPQLQAQQALGHQTQGSSSSQGSGSGHPLLQPSSTPPQSAPQQIPMSTRLYAANFANNPLHSGTMQTSAGLQQSNAARPLMSAGHQLHIPSSSMSGTLGPTSGGIPATAAASAPLQYNLVQAPKPGATGHAQPLQNGGPVQNGGMSHGTTTRYPMHNTNHAKLLHHSYRIQQFETTA